MMKNLTQIIATTILLISCDSLNGAKNLGDGYYLDTNQILYVENGIYKGIGTCIIPPEVIKWNKNEDYIIVNSYLYDTNVYWIIEKKIKKIKLQEVSKKDTTKVDYYFYSYYRYSNVQGPLDSITFHKELKYRNISLKLKNRK